MGLCIKLINNIDGNCQLNHHHHYHSSTTFQLLPSLALKCEMGNHHHASLSGFDVMGVFQPPTDPPSYRKARQGSGMHPTPSHISTQWKCFNHPPTLPCIEKKNGGSGTHSHTLLSCFDMIEVFQPPTNSFLYQKVRGGALVPILTPLSHFDVMGVFQPPSNPPLC